MPSKVIPKTLIELEELHTGTLMSRRDALLKCEESFELSDRYRHEPKSIDESVIEFKNTEAWKSAYSDLKAVLAKREHLPTGSERKAMRQEKSKRG